MLWRAEHLLMELKVFVASTGKAASVLSSRKMFHCVDSGFTATILTCTQLKRCCSIFNVFLQDPQNCLGNYASGYFSNTNGPHSRTLINGNEAACNKSSETIRVYSSGGYMLANIGQGGTKIGGGRFERGAHALPCLGIKTRGTSGTLGMQS